jgi:ABC-type methionine transport system ATPase subunit
MDIVVAFAGVHGERASVQWRQPVTFQVERGAAHVIRTKSAFSTPLLRMCLGFSEPRDGTVTVDGLEPWALNRNDVRALRSRLGCTLDPDGLVANMTIRMNLIVPLVFATGLPLDEASKRADGILELMHLRMWSEMRPNALSMEARQSVALARALCPQPALLLLENPLASVELRETRRLMSFCRVQAETILITTNRKDSILHEFADAVWDLDEDGFRRAA